MQSSGESGNSGPATKHPLELVRHVDSLAWQSAEGARWARAFGAPEGTQQLSLYLAELEPGKTHAVDTSEGEAVGYVLAGRGTVSIGGRQLPIDAGDGFHVRAGEAFALQSSEGRLLRLVVVICPSPKNEPWVKEVRGFRPPPRSFDGAYPERVVSGETAAKEAAGDRWFRILVGPGIGSDAVTQFVGSIPLSKAPEHYHLYEEVIYVLSGEGRLWTGDEHAPVGPDSLIFLPREQPHCLECTSGQGLQLVGMFYPAGSPAVNYSTGDRA